MEPIVDKLGKPITLGAKLLFATRVDGRLALKEGTVCEIRYRTSSPWRGGEPRTDRVVRVTGESRHGWRALSNLRQFDRCIVVS